MGIQELVRRGATDSNVISIGGGLPASELFPRKQLAAAFLDAIHDPGCPALQYDWPEGQDRLREWVASRLRNRGADVVPKDIIITAGAQQGLALASQILLPAGSSVSVDPETYPAALDLFRRRGATLVNREQSASCLYVVDGITNPRSQRFPEELRRRFTMGESPIIADEAYAELVWSGQVPRPLLADARDKVWHVGTLSKTLCPGLRIGWLVPPRNMVKRVVDLKQTIDLQTASLSQVIAENFLDDDDYEARLVRVRAFYQRRAGTLVSALRRWLPDWRFADPEGGFSVFAEVDSAGQEEPWLRTALSHGVAFDPGSLFRASGADQRLAMRLCFSATAPARLTEAVRRLARAWAAYRSRPE